MSGIDLEADLIATATDSVLTATLMLGLSIPSTDITIRTVGSEVEASAARASTDVFSPRGILNSNLLN